MFLEWHLTFLEVQSGSTSARNLKDCKAEMNEERKSKVLHLKQKCLEILSAGSTMLGQWAEQI